MTRSGLFLCVGFTVVVTVAAASHASEPSDYWPQWRGADQVGRSSTATGLPVTWSQTDNVVWRVKLPGWSAATPIIWGNHVFITSAEEGFNVPLKFEPQAQGASRNTRPESNEHSRLFLLAINRQDGSVLWKSPTGDGNRIMRKQNMASPSPVTDGKLVWVMTGVGILSSFNFDGKLLWQRDIQKDYGEFGLAWGYASSPKLHEDRLYIQVLHGMKTDEPSYVLAIDKKTGKTLWKVDRQTDAPREGPDNYATPILVPIEGELQLIVSGGDYVTGHDIDTGRELWRIGGFNPERRNDNRTISSSIAVGDMVFTSSRSGRPFIGFRAGGEGDITNQRELWQNNLGADVPTPTTDGKNIYVVNDRGIAVALDAKTGELVWNRRRLEPGTYSSSPLLADGKIFATNEDGATTVLKAGEEFEILAVNKLDDYTLASPVAVGNQIFIRTMEYLYCIGGK